MFVLFVAVFPRHFATGSPHDFCRGTLTTAASVGRLKEGEQMLMARTVPMWGLSR
jgi:hypothetical protein